LYRQTQLLGVLLILQVVALVGIGVHLFISIDWGRMSALASEQVPTLPKPLVQQVEQAILFVILPHVVLLLLAGLSFVLLRRRGWLLDSVARGVTLLARLCFYSYPRAIFGCLMLSTNSSCHSHLRCDLSNRKVHPSGGCTLG
jgi:hypothetical protein